MSDDIDYIHFEFDHVIDSISVVLIVISVCTAVGAWTWLWDSQTKQVIYHFSISQTHGQ